MPAVRDHSQVNFGVLASSHLAVPVTTLGVQDSETKLLRPYSCFSISSKFFINWLT